MSVSCQELDEWLETNTLDVKFESGTPYTTNDNCTVKIEQYRKNLNINIKYRTPRNIVLPAINGDTLYYTRFKLVFYFKNDTIPLNFTTKNNGFSSYVVDSGNLVLTMPRHNLYATYNANLNIPLYLFHNLKKGKNKVLMEFTQDEFQAPTSTRDSMAIDGYLTKKEKLISGKYSFEISVPEIYETVIYGNGIDLRSDDKFSPAGMDFAIIGQGYPDVYWGVFAPASDDKDFSNSCGYTPWQKNVTRYEGKDTFRIYHYSLNDNLIIGVYDHDDLSRDDFLGQWFGKISKLTSSKNKYQKLAFDNVAAFEVKAESNGVYNK